jgi:Undecaprenyl-phosphate glucose phosphotransferase
MTMLVQRAEQEDQTGPHRETKPDGSSPRAHDSLRQDQGSAFSAGFLAGLVLVCDVVAILVCGVLGHVLYPSGATYTIAQHLAAVGLFGAFTILALKSTGMYHFAAIVAPARQALRLAALLLLIFLTLAAAATAFDSVPLFSAMWTWALVWIVCTVVVLVIFRAFAASFIRSLARRGRLGRRILIYGATDQAKKLIDRIEKLAEPWNYIIGIFDDRVSRVGNSFGRYPVMGNLDDLITWGREHALDEVLVALPWSAQSRVLEVTRLLAVLPANVRLCPEMLDDEIMHGRASHHFGLPMWNAFEKPLEGWEAIGKRFFDILFSILVLLGATPLFVVLAVLIKLESRGPILFKQRRYGFNNEVIEVYKFRSMKQEFSDPDAQKLTERADPRVTRLGKLMRRTSLDELPQMLNVLRGEMSIVGPRPHAIRTTAGGRMCEDVVDRYSRRHRVRPGVTGWAQVNGLRGTMQDEEHLRKRIDHDLYYINNWSPWFDFKILAMTLWIVVGGRNSY